MPRSRAGASRVLTACRRQEGDEEDEALGLQLCTAAEAAPGAALAGGLLGAVVAALAGGGSTDELANLVEWLCRVLYHGHDRAQAAWQVGSPGRQLSF